MEGQDKFYQRIRNEGICWNYKRVRRVYCLLGVKQKEKNQKTYSDESKVSTYSTFKSQSGMVHGFYV